MSGKRREREGDETCVCPVRACGLKFANAGTFDMHRYRGKCLDPAEVVEKHTGRSLLVKDPLTDVWHHVDAQVDWAGLFGPAGES